MRSLFMRRQAQRVPRTRYALYLSGDIDATALTSNGGRSTVHRSVGALTDVPVIPGLVILPT